MAETSLLFGSTGAGKTTALGEASAYLYKSTGGKIGRAIYSDIGGYKPIQGLVDAGVIEVYNIAGEPNIPKLLHHLALGYWPEKLEKGVRPAGSKLKPPTDETWDKVGFYLYEGVTSSAELIMKFLRDKQIPIGGEAVGKFSIDDGADKMLFCSNNMKHYDFAQSEMLVVIGEFSTLPCSKVIMTAQEAQGQDDDTRDTIRGAAFVGKAATSKVGKNVGDYIHIETYAKADPAQQGQVLVTNRRAYFMAHPDPKFANIMYNCKPRIPLTEVSEVLKQFPGGWFDPARLGEYLEACDRAVARSTDKVRAWKAAADAELQAAR